MDRWAVLHCIWGNVARGRRRCRVSVWVEKRCGAEGSALGIVLVLEDSVIFEDEHEHEPEFPPARLLYATSTGASSFFPVRWPFPAVTPSKAFTLRPAPEGTGLAAKLKTMFFQVSPGLASRPSIALGS